MFFKYSYAGQKSSSEDEHEMELPWGLNYMCDV